MLVDAYRRVAANPRLARLKQAYGSLAGLGETSGPRALWVPTQDRIETVPQVRTIDGVTLLDGRTIRLNTVGVRVCGCEVAIAVPATGDETCYVVLETLLNDFLFALHESLWSYANYGVEGIEIEDREGLDDAEIGAVLTLNVRVPIYDSQRTAQLQGVAITATPGST